MDLREVTKISNRHPWELSRINALRNILRSNSKKRKLLRVLDVGCGDAYVVRNLFDERVVQQIDGIDIHLSESKIEKLSDLNANIKLHRSFENLNKNFYNVVLLLDVLEHIEDDHAFLNSIISQYVEPGGYVLITVPAFNSIFSLHDTFLGHYRRYNLKQLIHRINGVPLQCLFCGYLFMSLLPVRLCSLLLENLFSEKKGSNKGIGAWRHGQMITKAVELVLSFENSMLIYINRAGIKLPGLTAWALCQKTDTEI